MIYNEYEAWILELPASGTITTWFCVLKSKIHDVHFIGNIKEHKEVTKYHKNLVKIAIPKDKINLVLSITCNHFNAKKILAYRISELAVVAEVE